MGQKGLVIVNNSSDRVHNECVKGSDSCRINATVISALVRGTSRGNLRLTFRYYRRLGHTLVVREGVTSRLNCRRMAMIP